MDWGYIAGYFDGEGTAGVWKTSRVRPAVDRRGGISWANTDLASLAAMRDFMGCGTIRVKHHANPKWKDCYSLHIDSRRDLIYVIPHLLQHCIVKRDRLIEVLEWATNETVDRVDWWGLLAEAGVEEIRRLYWDEQLTQKQIGERFGVGSTGVRQYMKRNGIPTRTKSVATRMANRDSEAWRKRSKALSELRLAQWQDAEYRERMCAAMKAGRTRN